MAWWDSHLSFKKQISALKTECREALNLIRVVGYLKWEGDRDTLLVLYWAIVHSKLYYRCIVYGTALNTNLRQLDSIYNPGLRLDTEANEERRLKLSMHYYMKTRAHTDNPTHHAQHEFGPTTRDLYLPRPNGRGGMMHERTHSPNDNIITSKPRLLYIWSVAVRSMVL